MAKISRTAITTLLLILVITLSGTLMGVVRAAQITSAPTLWHTRQLTLSVQIIGGPSWARDSVNRSMAEWNYQQKGFTQRFYQNDSLGMQGTCVTCVAFQTNANDSYQFYFSQTYPVVTIVFSQGDSHPAGGELALTSYDGKQFTISVQSILTNVPDNETSREVLYRVMLHELGHVMGLGHIFDGKDIMDGNAYFLTDLHKKSYISTVDLNAVRQLALLGAKSLQPFAFISLPPSIPYELIDVD